MNGTNGDAYTVEELMAAVIARQVRDGETVAVGTLSPVPAAGVYLARELYASRARLLVHGDPAYPFRAGTKEFFDFAQKGAIDLFFLSGAQIDARGTINLHVIGDYALPRARLPGGAGSAMLYAMAGRVLLFKLEHDRRGLVERVDFVTATAETPPGVLRRGRPAGLLTPLAWFVYDEQAHRLRLASVHPGVTEEQVRAATGWTIEEHDVPQTPPPTAVELRALRGPVRELVGRIYPQFARERLRPLV
ncbi:MAG: CoA synthetase [Chloroflexota bacterium]